MVWKGRGGPQGFVGSPGHLGGKMHVEEVFRGGGEPNWGGSSCGHHCCTKNTQAWKQSLKQDNAEVFALR